MTPMPKAVAEAVSAVMADVKHVEKTGENKFHNYKFARVEDLLAQVQPAMVKAGLIVIQSEAHTELVSEGQAWAVTYSFGLQHKGGEAWDGQVLQTGMATARNSKGGLDDKALNKCHTAARKYFLLALLQVPTGDLPDADTEEDKPSPARAPAPQRSAPSMQAPKAPAPVDRSAEPVPVPDMGAETADWEAWRKIIASKINKAETGAQVATIMQVNAKGIVECQTVLDDTNERLSAFSMAKLEMLDANKE